MEGKVLKGDIEIIIGKMIGILDNNGDGSEGGGNGKKIIEKKKEGKKEKMIRIEEMSGIFRMERIEIVEKGMDLGLGEGN